MLGITELQLFEQAYLSSHRQSATNNQLEVFYALYCLQGTAPAWVTRFARQVLSDEMSTRGPRTSGVCSPITFVLELGSQLYVPPHSPETLGPDRYRTLVA